jgi:hypothetical protein
MVLMPRDLDLMALLGRFRRLTAQQIRVVVPFGSVQTASYRLQRLWQHAYVERDFWPVAMGGAPAIYRLGPLGQRALVAHRGDDGAPCPMASGNQERLFLEHALAVNDVLIAFMVAARLAGGQLDWSIPAKPLDRLPDPLDPGKKVPILPDAEVTCNTTGRKRHIFLEVDRGTEVSKRFGAKARGYLAYLASGNYEQRYGLRRFRLLVVAPGKKRRDTLERAVRETVMEAAPRLGKGPETLLSYVGYAVSDEIRPDTVFGEIWLCEGRMVSLFGSGGGP